MTKTINRLVSVDGAVNTKNGEDPGSPLWYFDVLGGARRVVRALRGSSG